MAGYVAPVPPTYDGSTGWQVTYTVAMSAAVVGFVVWWLRDPQERRRPYLPLMLVGGALACFFEPMIDNMVSFGWPHNAFVPIYHANGHAYPVYLVLGCIWFNGGFVYLFARLFQRNLLSTRRIWSIVAAFAIIDVPVNASGHWFHFNGFFGPQTMELWGYPVWWLTSDLVLMLLGGALLARILPYLSGPSVIALVLFPGINQGLAAGGVVWPASWALHTQMSTAGRWLCDLATIALGLGTVWFVTRFAASDRPEIANTGSDPVTERMRSDIAI
jgi:hypothetical protein